MRDFYVVPRPKNTYEKLIKKLKKKSFLLFQSRTPKWKDTTASFEDCRHTIHRC